MTLNFMDPLKRVEQELKKCVKCGACRAHCPVFSVLRREPATARGKIALATAALCGEVDLDGRTRSDMSRCLLCGRCVSRCANEAPTDLIVLAAREALSRKRGMPLFQRIVSVFLLNRGLMKAGASLARLCGPALFRKVPATSGLRLRFTLPFAGGKRHLPKITPRPFLSRYPEVIQGDPDKPRVAYFVGCMTNYLYPRIGEAAISLLKGLGCTIIIPRDQHCCGFPALSGGDTATSLALAERNLAALERHRPDFVMTACASCGGAFHRMYPRLLADRYPEMAERCGILAEKVVDASELLAILGFSPGTGGAGTGLRVAYHDPCHLIFRGITRQPRDLLKAAPDITYVEMEDANACCGLGGTFSVHHYETSMKINERKSEAIRNASVDAVATACPGCMLQLEDGLRRGGGTTRIQHILEVLAGRIN